jgi:type IV secretory pathway VirB10-like protein
MKTKTLILAVVGLLILLASSVVIAQSLGDLARQEQAKRAKETKKAVKVVTDEDLPPPAAETKPAAPPSESAEQPGEQPAEQPTEQATKPPATPPEEASAPPPAEEAKPEDKQKTRDYWQGRFKAAKQRIADAEELQRLAEDELSLLQIQQARELSPDAKSDLDAQVKAKSAEVESKRAQTAKAQKALEDLEKDFKESGAPEDWSKTD